MTNSGENKIDPSNWITNFSDYLLNYAIYRVSDQELAEDLVQDTFLSALKAIKNYNGLASEKTWLTAILKNKIKDHYKKASTQKESSFSDKANSGIFYDTYFNEDKMGHWQTQALPKDWGEGPITHQNEFQIVFQKCLEKIPVKWRAVFTMSIIDEEDTKDICKEHNLSSSNFWVIMHRSKLQLRACLEKNWLNL